MMNTLRVAAVQLTSISNWESNFSEVKRLVLLAVKDGARVIVLPENVFLFNGKKMRDFAMSAEQDTLLDSVKALATQHNVYLIIGSHPYVDIGETFTQINKRVRQRCWVISPEGLVIEHYDKIHLFDVEVNDKAGSYKESDVIEPGDLTPKVVDIDGFKVGLSICYDVRFPELYRALTKQGAELVVVPAAFTYMTGKAHWNTLLAARSIENQCYVLGVNQCGWHNETRQTYGHSVLYSPVGEVLAGLQEEIGYFVCDINKKALEECSARMPCLSHRRL